MRFIFKTLVLPQVTNLAILFQKVSTFDRDVGLPFRLNFKSSMGFLGSLAVAPCSP
jgi:hypothetical protein